jgi:iron(III) transport system substrate-binding protein
LRLLLLVLVAFGLAACSGEKQPASNAESELVLYSGRSQSLTEELIQRFEDQTGTNVKVKYGKSAELALALAEEGDQSPADVFWSQDAGALGAVADEALLQPLADEVVKDVPDMFRDSRKLWVATSGRARTLAYNGIDEADLPKSVFDLTQEKYKGQVGWAPANASFQSFVTAMRKMAGEEATEQWLLDMKANQTKSYAKNTPIIEALAAGEIRLGLPNHYYLLRFKHKDPNFPVKQTAFSEGDPGNLVNVAGVAILKTSKNTAAAQAFVSFLLSAEAQTYFAESTHEYPILGDSKNPDLLPIPALMRNAPVVSLGELRDLEATLSLLRKVGLL